MLTPLAKIIIGNKIDMTDSIKVTEAELKEFSTAISAPFVLTSALMDTGIDKAFDKIIENIEHFRSTIQGSMITSKKVTPTKKSEKCSC